MDKVRDNHILLQVFDHLNYRKRHRIIRYNKRIEKRLSFKVHTIVLPKRNNKNNRLSLKEIFEKLKK